MAAFKSIYLQFIIGTCADYELQKYDIFEKEAVHKESLDSLSTFRLWLVFPIGEVLEGNFVRLPGAVRNVFPAFAAGREEPDGVGGNLKRSARGAILPFPNARASVLVRDQSSFDQYFAALAQVLVAGLSQFAPGGNPEPGRFVYFLAVRAGVRSTGCNGKAGDCLAGRRVAHFRIASEVSDEDDGLKGHVSFSFLQVTAYMVENKCFQNNCTPD